MGQNPQESHPRTPAKYHGYTYVRGTPSLTKDHTAIHQLLDLVKMCRMELLDSSLERILPGTSHQDFQKMCWFTDTHCHGTQHIKAPSPRMAKPTKNNKTHLKATSSRKHGGLCGSRWSCWRLSCGSQTWPNCRNPQSAPLHSQAVLQQLANFFQQTFRIEKLSSHLCHRLSRDCRDLRPPSYPF